MCVCQSLFVVSLIWLLFSPTISSTMSKAKAKTKYAKGESRLHYILCVYPCPRYITSGDTHSLCMVCLGATLICLSGGGEASLVPLVDYLAAWKLLPMCLDGACTL